MLTGTTIGELPQLTAITLNTLFAVEYSGLTYNLPFSLIQANVSGSSGTSRMRGAILLDGQPIVGNCFQIIHISAAIPLWVELGIRPQIMEPMFLV